VSYELHHKLPTHDLIMEIVWKCSFMNSCFLHMDVGCLKHIWCTYKCGWKYFNYTYMCIIFVLDAWHLCAKNMNPWNNKFHANFEWTHEANKFVTLYGNPSLSLFVRPMIASIMHLWIKFISLSQTFNYSNCCWNISWCVHVFILWFLNWALCTCNLWIPQ
jgi:hypothetical protein